MTPSGMISTRNSCRSLLSESQVHNKELTVIVQPQTQTIHWITTTGQLIHMKFNSCMTRESFIS